MKAVVVLTILLALVAGVAASGPKSGILAATSVAFEQCAIGSDACQPLPRPLLAQTEAELAAIDRSAEGVGAAAGAGELGESRSWTFGIPAIGRELLDFFMSMIHRYGGIVRPGGTVAAETIFDPVR